MSEVRIINGFIKSWNDKIVTAYIVEEESIKDFLDDPPFENNRELFRIAKLFNGKQFAIVVTIQPGQMITKYYDSDYSKVRQLFNYWCYRARLWWKYHNLTKLERKTSKILAQMLKITSKP